MTRLPGRYSGNTEDFLKRGEFPSSTRRGPWLFVGIGVNSPDSGLGGGDAPTTKSNGGFLSGPKKPSGLAGRSLGEVWLSLTTLTKPLPVV